VIALLRRKPRPPTPDLRVSLDRHDIRYLFRGLPVCKGGVVVQLRDVGWTVVLAELRRVIEEEGLFEEVRER
jgi:hypothetical protein